MTIVSCNRGSFSTAVLHTDGAVAGRTGATSPRRDPLSPSGPCFYNPERGPAAIDSLSTSARLAGGRSTRSGPLQFAGRRTLRAWRARGG